jgi:hypothetical protein
MATPPATPRWVKAFGMIALIITLLIGVIFLTGGARHGPGRHLPPSNQQDDAGGWAVFGVTDVTRTAHTEHSQRDWLDGFTFSQVPAEAQQQ